MSKDQYIADLADFVCPRQGLGIHGISHVTRVLIWTQVIAKQLKRSDYEKKILALAAKYHDCHRHGDGDDIEHGERAASYLEKNNFLPSDMSQQIAYLCRWHVPADDKAPAMTKLLQIFKDADALDRCRINDFNPSFLRTDVAVDLIEDAQMLWEITADQINPHQIITAASLTINFVLELGED